MLENEIMHRIQVKASEKGFRLFRNQVGKYKLADGRWLTSGLCVGSSDLIGFKIQIVTQDMVGKPVALFAAVEVKTDKGKATVEQVDFLRAVAEAGGVSILARRENDLGS